METAALANGTVLSKRKKVKQPKANARPKCTFWLPHKKRFCKLERVNDTQQFCGEHLKMEDEFVGGNGKTLERIPCPLDKTHSCFKHLLEQHLLKCNSRRKEEPEYIQEDVNLVIEPLSWVQLQHKGHEKDMDFDFNNYKLKAMKDLSNEEYSSMIRTIVSHHLGKVVTTPDYFGQHPIIARELVRSDIGQRAAKHFSQVGSILNILENEGLLEDGTCFIEYGSGRGSITYHLAQAVQEKKLKECCFVLIDKTSPRHKLDNKLTGHGVSFSRIRADIKNLRVGQLPYVQSEKVKRIVGVAKHLCGSAADMALHSLFDRASNTSFEKVSGCLFATCCHHRCELINFTGHEFLAERFKPGEILALSQMSSWATNGDRTSLLYDNKEMDPIHMRFFTELKDRMVPDLFYRQTIGGYVKRIFDTGRVHYLTSLFEQQNMDLQGELVNFVDELTSQENKVILVCKPSTRTADRKKEAEEDMGLRRLKVHEVLISVEEPITLGWGNRP